MSKIEETLGKLKTNVDEIAKDRDRLKRINEILMSLLDDATPFFACQNCGIFIDPEEFEEFESQECENCQEADMIEVRVLAVEAINEALKEK